MVSLSRRGFLKGLAAITGAASALFASEPEEPVTREAMNMRAHDSAERSGSKRPGKTLYTTGYVSVDPQTLQRWAVESPWSTGWTIVK